MRWCSLCKVKRIGKLSYQREMNAELEKRLVKKVEMEQMEEIRERVEEYK